MYVPVCLWGALVKYSTYLEKSIKSKLDKYRRGRRRFIRNITRKRFNQRNIYIHFHKMKISSLKLSQRPFVRFKPFAISGYTILMNPRVYAGLQCFFTLIEYIMPLYVLAIRQNYASHLISLAVLNLNRVRKILYIDQLTSRFYI